MSRARRDGVGCASLRNGLHRRRYMMRQELGDGVLGNRQILPRDRMAGCFVVWARGRVLERTLTGRCMVATMGMAVTLERVQQ